MAKRYLGQAKRHTDLDQAYVIEASLRPTLNANTNSPTHTYFHQHSQRVIQTTLSRSYFPQPPKTRPDVTFPSPSSLHAKFCSHLSGASVQYRGRRRAGAEALTSHTNCVFLDIHDHCVSLGKYPRFVAPMEVSDFYEPVPLVGQGWSAHLVEEMGTRSRVAAMTIYSSNAFQVVRREHIYKRFISKAPLISTWCLSGDGHISR